MRRWLSRDITPRPTLQLPLPGPAVPADFAMADTGRPAWMIGFWDGISD
jgi:hypothetical protein